MQIRVAPMGIFLSVVLSGCAGVRHEKETAETRRATETHPTPTAVQSALRYRWVAYGPRGVRVPVPSAGYEIRHRTFTGSTSASKIKETLSVRRGGLETVVSVDTWNNPARLTLSSWFDANLAYLTEYGGSLEQTRGTAHNTAVWRVYQARSPQARARIYAVFVLSGYAFRVTCHDAEDPETLEIFKKVVSHLSLSEVRP